MKKYRLKEEAKEKLKPFLGTIELNYEMPLSDWHNKFNVFSEQFFTCELEEVKERIELTWCRNHSFYADNKKIAKKNNDDFSGSEINKMQKALNGELFTKDDIKNPITVIHSFEHWYYNNTPLIIDEVGLDGVCNAYRKYLKEKK